MMGKASLSFLAITGATAASGIGILIDRGNNLRDADFIRLSDTSNDQDLNAARDIEFNDAGSQLEVDASFTHSTGTDPSQVTGTENDDAEG